jgi:hypothetical protein
MRLRGAIVRLTAELEETAVARWYRAARFRGDPPARRETGGMVQRLNWQTRTRYYETLVELLDATGGSTEGLARDELAAAAGQRRPSTLYYLVSPKSAGSLAGALLTSSPRRLYERQRGERVIDLLTTEAKVWSYWPHREGWLAALDDLAVTDRWLAAASLVRVLADWATCTQSLATTAAFAPPVAAVEDLLTLTDTGRAAPPAGYALVPAQPGAPAVAPAAGPGSGHGDPLVAAVTALLTTVVRMSLGSSGIGPGLVLGAVHSGLASLVALDRAAPEKVTAEAADVLTQLEHLVPRLSPDERGRMADELDPRLRAVLALLARPGPTARAAPPDDQATAGASTAPAPPPDGPGDDGDDARSGR